MPVIGPVTHPVVAKRHISDGKVKNAVRVLRFLKAVDLDAGIGIELAGDTPGDAVQLHAVQLAFAHALREHPEEVAYAAGRFYVPTDFDTKEKAFFGAKAAEKDLKQGLPRSYSDFGSPCFMCLVILLPLGNAAGYQPCGVAILE